MDNAGDIAGAAPTTSTGIPPVTATGTTPAAKTSPDSGPGVPAIMSPPATEPESAFGDGGDVNPPPSSQIETVPMQPAAEARFVPISTAEAPEAPLATKPESDNMEPAPTTPSIIPKPATVEDAPSEDTPPTHLPSDMDAFVSAGEFPKILKTNNKRTADAADLDGGNNELSSNTDKQPTRQDPQAEASVAEEHAEKKTKTDDDATLAPATFGRRARKSFRKRMRELPPVGQTHRKTRSQGPIETTSL